MVPQKLGIHPFGGGVAVLSGFLDSILVGFVGLVVGSVVLRLRHFPRWKKNEAVTAIRVSVRVLGAYEENM